MRAARRRRSGTRRPKRKSRSRSGTPRVVATLIDAAKKSAKSTNGTGTVHIEATERFEVDRWGRVFRTIKRRKGKPQITQVTKLPVGVKPSACGDAELRAFADHAYLSSRVRTRIESTKARKRASDDEIRVVDMFGGCGAMTLGVADACQALGLKFRAVGAFEVDGAALGVFCRNFGGPEPIRDVSRLLTKRLTAHATKRERELQSQLGRVDFLVAGPPCQGHSNLNNETRRKDPRNELYFRVARFARLFKPRWIVIENVQAVLHDADKVVGRTRRALEKMGYMVDEGIVRLADLGVAQTRRRHVMIGVHKRAREGAKVDSKVIPTLAEIVARFEVPKRTLRWAIDDLRGKRSRAVFDSSAEPSDATRRRIKWLFDHAIFDLPNTQRPKCHRESKKRNGESHRYIGVYGRMRWDEAAPTITSGYDTMGRGRFVHPSQRRTVTPHEAARIQFFPDSFDFSPANETRTRLAQIIGNAVPPKLTYTIALELLR